MTGRRVALLLVVLFLAVGCAGREVMSSSDVIVDTPTSQPAATSTVSSAPPTPTNTPVLPTVTPTPTSKPSPRTKPLLPALDIPAPIEAMSPANMERIELLARPGKGVIVSTPALGWSPGGDLLAFGTSIGVYLYAPDTMEELMFIETEEPVTVLAFSPDGDLLATGGKFGGIRLWKVPGGGLLQTFDGHKEGVRRLVFAPAGDMLVSSSKDGSVHLWSVPDGELLRVIESDGCSGGHCMGYGIDISPDGQVLAVGTEDGYVQLWRVSDGEMLRSFKKEPEDSIGSLAFSPDGEIIAVNSWKNGYKVYFWRVSDGELVQSTSAVWGGQGITFSPDGRVLASRWGVYIIARWQVPELELLPILSMCPPSSAYSCWITVVDFSKDGMLLAAAYDIDLDTLCAWRVPVDVNPEEFPEKGVSTHTAFTRPMISMALSPDGALVASGMSHGNVYLWRTSDGSVMRTIAKHRDKGVTRVAFSPDGEYLATTSASDGVTYLWRLSDMVLLHTFEDSPDGIVFGMDGMLLAVGNRDGVITIRGVAADGSMPVLNILNTGAEGAYSLAFSPDGKMLASGTVALDESGSPDPALGGNAVTLWDTSDGKPIRTFADDLKGVRDMAFSPDGRFLAAGVGDEIRLWGVSDGEPVLTIEAGGEVYSLAFSPGGDVLAAGVGRDVVLWRVPDGEQLRVLEGHKDAVVGVAFSEDGKLLVSGSYDGTLRLWGVVE